MTSVNSYMEKLNAILNDTDISQQNCVEQLKALKNTIENEEPVQPHHLDTLESLFQEGFEKNAILTSIEGLLNVFDTSK